VKNLLAFPCGGEILRFAQNDMKSTIYDRAKYSFLAASLRSFLLTMRYLTNKASLPASLAPGNLRIPYPLPQPVEHPGAVRIAGKVFLPLRF